jgi:septation ring formation regulator EzrA
MLRINLNPFLLLVVIILLVSIYESHSQLSVLQDTMSQLVLEIEDMKKINSDLAASIEKVEKAELSATTKALLIGSYMIVSSALGSCLGTLLNIYLFP